jgi:hypothetical protein
MKDKLLFLALVSTIFIAWASTVQAAPNLLLNPSFEEDGDGNGDPDNWGLWGSNWSWGGDSTQEWITDPAQALDGNVSAHLRAGGGDYAMAIPSRVPATAGTVYYGGFYVKDLLPDGGPSISDPEFKMEFYAGGTRDDSLTYAVYLPIAHTGEYELVVHQVTCPTGIDEILFIPMSSNWSGSGQTDYMWDYGSFSTDMPTGLAAGAATDPAPGHEAESVSPDTDELSWTNPEQASPSEIIECDVWFSNDFPEYGNHNGDPNFTTYADQIVTMEATDAVTLSTLIPAIDLVMGEVYYWRVDCYDPNKMVTDPDNYPAIGKVWTFDTINRAPVVDAGVKQNAWLDAGSVAVNLDATVSDDGLPLSATVTYEWTLDSGPDTPTFDPSNTVEDPEVTFDTAGTYVLNLTADDTLLTGSDTVTINVFESTYTGLVAHWALDETSGISASDSVGGHTGDLIGDPTWMPAGGQVNGGLLLDGDGDYIEIPDSTHASKPTWADDLADEVTLSIWMKTSDGNFGDDWAGLISRSNEAWRIQRAGSSNNVELVIEGAAYVVSDMMVNDDKWHQVTGVYTGDMAYLYVDGFPQGEVVADGTPGVGTEPIWIGAGLNVDYPANDFHFNGMIDEARIYEVGLTAERVLVQFIDDGGSNSCGGIYDVVDLNQDCYIGIDDFIILLGDWMDCTDITNPDCN